LDSARRQAAAAPLLDHPVFWLRWLLLGGVALLALAAEEIVVGEGRALDRDHLILALIAGIAGNLALGLLAYAARLSESLRGVLAALLDSALAGLFLWVYQGGGGPLLVFGTLAVCLGAYRLGWRGLIFSALALGAATAAALLRLGDWRSSTLLDAGVSLALALAFGLLGEALRRPRARGEGGREAQRLHAARERTRAVYEMANTLSATLDHRRVLDTAQNIGALVLREELGPGCQVISAVLLFQGPDNQLRVITARGLTRRDEGVAVPGVQGVLGEALEQARPVFTGAAAADPELRYFSAFQDARSVLAIPLRAGYDVYGVMVFGCDGPGAFSEEHVELMTAIGTQSTLALQNAVLYQNLLGEKERIVEVEEDTRKKLSRDLHDGPTQNIAAIAMRVNYIRRLLERQPEQAIEELWKVEDLARRTTREIRHMLFTLRPLVLENQGLLAALHQLAAKMGDTYSTHVEIQAQPEVERQLDAHAQGVLFYVVEEAVNNARKHAQAEAIWVRLFERESFVVVEIEDNGVGFDLDGVDATYDQRGSLGMVNMRERAELIEGDLQIRSVPGRGTTIRVVVPCRAGAPADGRGGELGPPPLTLHARRATQPPTTPGPSAAPVSPPSVPPVSPPDPRPARKPLRRLQPSPPESPPAPDR